MKFLWTWVYSNNRSHPCFKFQIGSGSGSMSLRTSGFHHWMNSWWQESEIYRASPIINVTPAYRCMFITWGVVPGVVLNVSPGSNSRQPCRRQATPVSHGRPFVRRRTGSKDGRRATRTSVNGGFHKWALPQNGWFIIETLTKMDDFGAPPF